MFRVRVDADFERSRDFCSGKYVLTAVSCKHPSSIRPTCGSVRGIDDRGIANRNRTFTLPLPNKPRNGRPGTKHDFEHLSDFLSPLLPHDRLDSTAATNKQPLPSPGYLGIAGLVWVFCCICFIMGGNQGGGAVCHARRWLV